MRWRANRTPRFDALVSDRETVRLHMSRPLVGLVAAGVLFTAAPARAEPPPPPELIVPKHVTAEPQSRAGARVTFRASGTDWKEAAVPVSCRPAAGSLFPLGRSTVSCTATDRRHESTTKSFPLTVERLYRPAEGATVRAFQRVRFAWFPVPRARLYNVQLWWRSPRGWIEVASFFPKRERLVLRRSWSHNGRRHRLVRGGSYVWYAWPWFGSRYGRLLGRNFLVVR